MKPKYRFRRAIHHIIAINKGHRKTKGKFFKMIDEVHKKCEESESRKHNPKPKKISEYRNRGGTFKSAHHHFHGHLPSSHDHSEGIDDNRTS